MQISFRFSPHWKWNLTEKYIYVGALRKWRQVGFSVFVEKEGLDP